MTSLHRAKPQTPLAVMRQQQQHTQPSAKRRRAGILHSKASQVVGREEAQPCFCCCVCGPDGAGSARGFVMLRVWTSYLPKLEANPIIREGAQLNRAARAIPCQGKQLQL